MKKKLVNGNQLSTLTPKLTGITCVPPEIVGTLNETPLDSVTVMREDSSSRSSGRRSSGRQSSGRLSSRRYNEDTVDRSGSTDTESDLAESPAAASIQSSYKSPIFHDFVDITPCPVDGCPLNPDVSFKTFFPQFFIALRLFQKKKFYCSNCGP